MAFLSDLEKVLDQKIDEHGGNVISGIRAFQSENGFQSDRVSSAVSLLAELGVRREEVFQGIMEALREALVTEMANESPEKLYQLLGPTLDDMIAHPNLRAVAHTLFEKSTDVEERHLRALARNAPNGKPYVDLSLALKQKIWGVDNEVFKKEVFPYVTRLSDNYDLAGRVTKHTLNNNSAEQERARRLETPELKSLCMRVGNTERLVLQALRVLRHRLIESGMTVFNSISLDFVLMSNEISPEKLVENSSDPTLHFALKLGELDVFVKNPQQDVSTLRGKIEEERQDRTETMAVYLGAVPVIHTLSSLMLRHLRALRKGGAALRENFELDDYLRDLSYLIILGFTARNVILEKKLEPESEELLCVQVALMYRLICEDMDREATGDDADLPNDMLYKVTKKSPLLQRLICSYSVDLFKQKDFVGVWRLRKPLEYIHMAAGHDNREKHVSEFMLQVSNADVLYPLDDAES